jgi:hypothetical protein
VNLRVAPLLLATTLALLGCAGPTSLTSQVVSYGQWDAQRQPGSFVFERLPSQQAEPEHQASLEAAALPALRRAGFTPAEAGSQATYSVQLATQAHVESPRWDPYGGPPWMGAYPWGPRGIWMGQPGPPMVWPSPPPPRPHGRMQVDLLLRERATGAVLYEAHVRHERPGTVDDRLWPALMAAAMQRFPATQREAVDIVVPLSPDQR